MTVAVAAVLGLTHVPDWAAVLACVTVVCVVMPWALPGRCEHDWEYRDSTTIGVYDAFSNSGRPTDLYTEVLWVCARCRRTKTTEIRGTWPADHLHGIRP